MEQRKEVEDLYERLMADLVMSAVRFHDYLVDLHGSDGLAEDLIQVFRLFGVQNLNAGRFAVHVKKLLFESEQAGKAQNSPKSQQTGKDQKNAKSQQSRLSNEKEKSKEPSLSKSTEKEKKEMFRKVIESLLKDSGFLGGIFESLKSKSKNYLDQSQLEFNLRNLDGENLNPSGRSPGKANSTASEVGTIKKKSVSKLQSQRQSQFSDRFGAVGKEDDFITRLLRQLDDRLYPPVIQPNAPSIAHSKGSLQSAEFLDRNTIAKLETILELKELKLQDDEEERKRGAEQTNRFVLTLQNESRMFCLLNGLLFAFIFYLLIKQLVNA